MRNIASSGMLGADRRYAMIWSFTSFGESVVARVEVLAFLNGIAQYQKICHGYEEGLYLQFVLQEVLLVGKFAVQTEQTLFVGGKRLDMVSKKPERSYSVCTHADVNLVFLVWVHLAECSDLYAKIDLG